jgi:hypothetical protein
VPEGRGGLNPFWVWVQVLIVICVIASAIIAIIRLV